MKLTVKNIRQFRTFYKKEVKRRNSSDHNEHFVGVSKYFPDGKVEFGFFELFHGDKEGRTGAEGIKGYLTGLLDMAKDGQAIYEFMQNAIDAESTKLGLFFEKDPISGQSYLLVINNGRPFTFKDIRSILNVGISTKSEDRSNIGKFGIGFKLAHRLVGKQNGLIELVDRNFGPLLFSWQKNEIYKIVSSDDIEVENLEQRYKTILPKNEYNKPEFYCEDDAPWYFKILSTVFPCGINDPIYDNHYTYRDNVFSKEESDIFFRWIRKQADYINDDFQEGSAFFMRLGEGKISHLSNDRLIEGIKFSLSILNHLVSNSKAKLKELKLNSKFIEAIDLQFIRIIIDKEENDYKYIFGESSYEDMEDSVRIDRIEMLFGYVDYYKSKEVFKNSPNFYLYFPLSEEKHDFRFLIHSNAFDKSASRTYLLNGEGQSNGINERLFSVFQRLFLKRLEQLLQTGNPDDRNKFLNIYANLLLSNPSENQREWVNKPLYNPIFNWISNNIPVYRSNDQSFEICHKNSSVFILKIGIPIPIDKLILAKLNFFYWSYDPVLSDHAIQKFDLKSIDLYRILINTDSARILNNWLDENDNDRYALQAISELNQLIEDKGVYSNLNFQKSFEEVRWFKFKDKSRFSLNQLKEKECFSTYLLHLEVFDEITEFLEQVGFVFSEIRIGNFSNIQKYLLQIRQNFIPYTYYENIPEVLNLRLENYAQVLGSHSKIGLLKGVYKIDEKNRNKEERQKRVSKLYLFKNNKGSLVPLSSLIYQAKYEWLKYYEIQDSEFDDELLDYLSKNTKQLYTDIIIPNWDDIVAQTTDFSGLYKDINDLYDPTYPNLLTKKYFIVKGVSVHYNPKIHFYSNHLIKFSKSKYDHLSSFFNMAFQLQLPDYEILSYLNNAPFFTSNEDIPYTYYMVKGKYSYEEIDAFLLLCKLDSLLFFEKATIWIQDGSYFMAPISKDKTNCFTLNEKEAQIIQWFLPEFVLLPNEFFNFKILGAESESSLGHRIIEGLINKEWSEETIIQDYLLSLNNELKLIFCQKCPSICFNIDKGENNNYKEITFLRILNSLPLDQIKSENITSKICIETDQKEIALNTLVKIPTTQLEFQNGAKVDTSKILNKQQLFGLGDFLSVLSEWGLSETEIESLKAILEFKAKIDVRDVINELIHSLHDHIIQNDEQLFFILLCYSSSHLRSEIPSCLEVYTENNSTICLFDQHNLVYSERNFKYFDPAFILHEKYKGLKVKLDKFPLSEKIDLRIISEPVFVNNKFITAPLEELISDDIILEFIDWLYHFWLSETKGAGELEYDWSQVFPFDPKNIVSTDNAIDSERMPEYLKLWYELDPVTIGLKRHFLKKLGVNTKSSAVNVLRTELFNNSFTRHKELIKEISAKSNVLLANCIYYYQLKTNHPLFKLSDHIYTILDNIYNILNLELLLDSFLPIEVQNGIFSLTKKKENDLIIDHDSKQQLSVSGISESNLRINFSKIQIFDSTQFGFLRLIKDTFSPVRIAPPIFNRSLALENCHEWNAKFYLDWKQKYNYSIYSLNRETPWVTIISSIYELKFNSGIIHIDNKDIFINSTLSSYHALKTVQENNLIPDSIIEDLLDGYEIYQNKLNSFIAQIESGQDEELRDKWESFKKELEVEEHKKEITNNLNIAGSKYSISWFINYLELLVVSSDKADTRDIEKEISFGKFENNVETDNLFTLRDPSRTITPTIEYCTDFYATIHYGKKKIESIKINGVTKKGQTLIVLIKDITFLKNVPLDQINRVDVTFSGAIDLLERLRSSFNTVLNRINADINHHIFKYLPDNVDFVFGPPGTGKTTWLSDHISGQIDRNELKILVLTPTNKAADVITEKIIEKVGIDDAMLWLVRYGTTQSKVVFENDLMYDRNTFIFDRFTRLVFVSTIHRLPYEEVIINNKAVNEIKRICDCDWDIVIFDEASMIPLPYIVFALLAQSLQKPPRFFIAGDPFQIPPVIVFDDKDLEESDLKEENIFSLIGLNTFDPVKQKEISKYGDRIINLTTQYRSLPVIGKLFDFQCRHITLPVDLIKRCHRFSFI